MSFSVTSTKLTGNPDSSGWSQTYDFKPDHPEKLQKRGHLFAVISTSSQEEGIDIVVAGREVLARLHEEYFGKLEGTPYLALQNAVEKVINEFSSWKSVEIAVLTLVDSTAYIAAGGSASSFLCRDGNLFELVNSEADKVVVGSGKPRQGDIILIGSKSFFGTFSQKTIKDSLRGRGLSSAVEFFAPLVHSQENEGGIGFLLVQFNEKVVSNGFKDGDIKSVLNAEKKKVVDSKEPSAFNRKFKNVRSAVFGIFGKVWKRDIFLKEKKLDRSVEKSKKTSFLVGILLLIILSVSIFFGVNQKRKTDLKASYESQLVSAEHELQESNSLYLLNPQRSRELFNQARDKISSLSLEGIDDPKLTELKEKIKEGEENILGQYSVTPSLFVDLNLFSEGFAVDEVTSSDDTIYILDKSSEKIVEVSLANKRTEVFAGRAEVDGANAIASYSGRVFIATNDGLYELNNGRIEIDESGGDVLIGAYAGNIYALDKNASKIYRYPATSSGYGTKKEWLREGVDVNLSDARSLKIDGMIWVLVNEREIEKFSLGNLLNLNFEGVYPEIEKINDVYTDEESEYLYVLEKDKGRVAVTAKEGEYKAQYLNEGIKDAKMLVVSEKEKKAFLLTNNKIFSLDLRHLD